MLASWISKVGKGINGSTDKVTRLCRVGKGNREGRKSRGSSDTDTDCYRPRSLLEVPKISERNKKGEPEAEVLLMKELIVRQPLS